MKILYVTTVSNTVNAFLIPHIKMLIDEGHKVDVAFNIDQEVKSELGTMGCQVHKVPFQRLPIHRDNLQAYHVIKGIMLDNKYDIVHTHTPVASAIVRLACRNINTVKVYYTAHGFHFFDKAPLKNWLFYYPAEKLLSKYTDTLITINKEDYIRAKSSFNAGRTRYMPGVGLDLKKIKKTNTRKSLKRQELNLSDTDFIVLSVGELNKNKNHEVIIRAISELNDPAIHYLICGEGPLKPYLIELAKELNMYDQLHLLGFRNDIAEICEASDIFAFPSLREGLGMAALEAMACGLPIVTSNVHGIVDYSTNSKTGYTCSPTDVASFSQGIMKLYSNEEEREETGKHNLNKVKKYSLENTLNSLLEIYETGEVYHV